MVSRELPSVREMEAWLSKFGEKWDGSAHKPALDLLMRAIVSRDSKRFAHALMRADVQAFLMSIPMNESMFTPGALAMMPKSERDTLKPAPPASDPAEEGGAGT